MDSTDLHHDYIPVSRDTVPFYENHQYDVLIADIDAALHAVATCRINIFMDASGQTFAVDNQGNPIEKRLIVGTEYLYPQTDVSGNSYPGSLVITFDNGSIFVNSDADETTYWYSIEGLVPVVIKQFT